MYLKNITNSTEHVDFFGAMVEPNEFYDIPDEGTDLELYSEIQTKIDNDIFIISLDKQHVFSKEDSLSYIKNYTMDKTEFRIYDKVYAHSRFENLGDINYETQVNDGISFSDEVFRFGRKIRKNGAWYNNGSPDYSSPIMRVNYDYKFDSGGYVDAIEKHLIYYKKNGELYHAKTSVETFSPVKKTKETVDRRQLIYSRVLGTAQLLLAGQGMPQNDIIGLADAFSKTLNDPIRLYVNHGVIDIITQLSKTTAEIETDLGMPGMLGFLDLEVDPVNVPGFSFKQFCVAEMDYRSVEDGKTQEEMNAIYSGSLL